MYDEENKFTEESKATEENKNTEPYQYGDPYQYGQNAQSTNTEYTQQYQDTYRNIPPEEPAGFAIASLVLGIISLVLSCTMINIITGILALVFGIVHMVKYQSRKGMAIAGIVLGIISIVIMIILIVVGVAVMATPEWQTMINEL